MFIFGEKSLKEKIESLQGDLNILERSYQYVKEEIAGVDIKNSRIRLNHLLEISRKDDEIHEIKSTLGSRVEKEVAQTKKDYKIKTDNLEREHSNKMKSLEKEYVEKLARVDRKLEEDKSSFRKYLKTEFNSKVENLEKENAKLVKDNGELLGKVGGLNRAIDLFQGSINPAISLAEKVIAALPTVSATITTPEVNVQVPGAQGQKGGNNDQKKN